MYDPTTRHRLAEELVDAFCEGSWQVEELAERGAGRLDRWPGWLSELARHISTIGRGRAIHATATGRRAASELSFSGRRELEAEVRRFLLGRRPRLGDEVAPRIIRDVAVAVAAPPSAVRVAHGWPVAEISTVPELAERLELSNGQLEWLADIRGLERSVDSERLRNYRYRWVARRQGLPRLIEAPKLRLKEVQRFILREILDHVPAHDAACGFVRGRSVIDHASRHTGQAAVLRLDLRDFFTSVPAGRVFALLRELGYESPVAHVLTGLTTNTSAQIARDALRGITPDARADARFHLERRLATPHLPQGAPTSPALANLAAFGLDRRLTALASALDLRYSRYADDIALSGSRLRRGAQAQAATELVRRIARDEGFVVHPGKSRLRTAARRQQLTGVVVNGHPNVAREHYDRLRATLHRARRDGPDAVSLPGLRAGGDVRAHLNGRVAWVETVNPGRGAKLRRQFDAIDWG